ncbi:hypothetical protein NDU88_003533 [Pleurodeles waltl]|uniref:Uncharacterized protein n=1 Tax=Pleurodeles waltl TaxID=8319 RepID=A0AAV7VDP8_PLEWA|nr:hypothetical protein NDU88_003533 [Pleurodeles waltl]
MCLTDTPFSESRPRRKLDEPPGGRLRHWGRAALELRLGNASTSKAPGKVSREPGRAVTRAFSENSKKASEAAAGAGATIRTREEEKSPAPPQSSIGLWQIKLKIMRGLAECWYQIRRLAKLTYYIFNAPIWDSPGFPEANEGEDMHSFLRETLPKLTGITFDPPLEFQRTHRLSPKRPEATIRPRQIIACLLRHTQAWQLLQRARTHKPCQMDGQEIWISADFSKETSERRRAFLALQPRLRQMEVKYGLFEPATMWVTKNGVSQDFYNPEDL